MKPQSIANASGFPLQIRIANIIDNNWGWDILSEEHPWQSDDTGKEGFIDLIAADSNHRLENIVIECKRVRDTKWVFLIPRKNPRNRSHARLWETSYENNNLKRFGWIDWQSEPVSYESKYCAIQGQSQGRQTLLERTAYELIESTEALAHQEKALKKYQNKIYIPLIVTTAELNIASFEPNTVAISDGSLPPDTEFKIVPYIRFRKSLSTKINPQKNGSLPDVYQANERTVFVVNAESFNEFIGSWDLK